MEYVINNPQNEVAGYQRQRRYLPDIALTAVAQTDRDQAALDYLDHARIHADDSEIIAAFLAGTDWRDNNFRAIRANHVTLTADGIIQDYPEKPPF